MSRLKCQNGLVEITLSDHERTRMLSCDTIEISDSRFATDGGIDALKMIRVRFEGALETDSPTDIYHAQYQLDSVSERACEAYDAIAEHLHRHFKPERAIDIGSGGGALVRGLRKLGVTSYGVEGSRHAIGLTDGVMYHDLREPGGIPWEEGTFDLVTSFDCAEHVPESSAGTLAHHVASACKPGGWVCFGAAGERQPGTGHVNCQHPAFWIHLLCEVEGLKLHAGLSGQLRTELRADERTGFIWWTSESVMVFHKPN